MDTAKDARILVLEDALRRLSEIVSNRKLKIHIDYGKLNALLKQAGSLLYEVKYSYVDVGKLAILNATKNLLASIQELEEIYRKAITGFKPASSKEELIIAEMEYTLRIVNRFPQRLLDFDDDPAYAVDILAVEVSQVKPLEGSKNLNECRCTDGKRIWKIATNLEGIKPDIRLACAVLPPADMMGFVSEAMFLGGGPLESTVELGALHQVPASALDQARAQVMQITKRMG